ncbi:polysaccharide biosynthesis protein [Protaetiibacter intestinalis]|nr:hypothetical protein [Protaetiibacter intestinalis]
MAIATVVGVLATAGFQLVAINGLSPEDFGLLAAFLAVINVVSVGSAALRTSVAVTVAEGGTVTPARRLRDGTLLEAIVLGGAAAAVLLLASPLLATLLDADVRAVFATAAAALPYFLFARAQGILQGRGRARAVVWWTTGSQVAVLLFAMVVLLSQGGVDGLLLVVVVVTLAFTAGSTWHASRGMAPLSARAFTSGGVVVLAITIGFAWLTSADVIFVRAGVGGDDAGAYAAAGVLVKALLIVPATLGLYLLPRFVGRRDDAAMTRLGVNVILAITVLCGLLMVLATWLFGPWLVGVLYPESYALTSQLLPWMALMWLPWAAAQGVLVRITAARSRAGMVIVLLVVALQTAVALLTLHDLEAFMLGYGLTGLAALIALFAVHAATSRTLPPIV